MTFPRSSRSRAISANLAWASFFLLAACSLSETAPETTQEPKAREFSSPTRERIRDHARWGKFEWAIQDYEAGNYQEAADEFRKLESSGANLEDFDLVPYYLGMSYYHLGKLQPGAEKLERFNQIAKDRREIQESRITLLLIYEQLKNWPRVLGLAAEMNDQSLFHSNQALHKLVWARALRETGELQGAKAVMKDVTQYLSQGPEQEENWGQPTDPKNDLWGRFHYTALLLAEDECAKNTPNKVGTGKRAKPLYNVWLEATADCVQNLITLASRELYRKESAWSALAAESNARSVREFGTKIQAFLKTEGKVLEARRSLEKVARQQLYRILTRLDENLKKLKEQEVSAQHLESLRKQIDLLLVSISRPS